MGAMKAEGGKAVDESSVREEKHLLRQSIARKRAALSAAYQRAASNQIAEAFLRSSFYQSAKSLFVYIGVAGEPDTKRIIEQAWADGKNVFVPLCHGKGMMDAVAIQSWNDLVPGRLGIPEPKENKASLSPALDLAVVPCVCASRDGRRLGHGAGYYDRFFSAHPMKTVCLCFEQLITGDIPIDSLDQPMDAVLTEAGWFFGKK